MAAKDKKLAVLHQLSQETEPIGLAELVRKLGSGYFERSVRRWLSEMIAEGLIEKSGQKRGTRYLVVQRARRPEGKNNSCFGEESLRVIEKIERPLYERTPVAYDDHWLDNYEPNRTFYVPPEWRERLHTAGQRARREDPAGTYARHIFHRLLIDLSYNSSRLEGNTYSLIDTERLVIGGASAEGKLDEEKIMILNHKEAIRYLVDNAPRIQVSEETICTLHYLLSDGLVEARYSGKLRDHPVRIGGSTYLPFEEKRALQLRFSHIVEKATSIKDPYEQSLFLLAHISYLQGFADVNKRTARLSANIPFIKMNLVPLSFNDVGRDEYTSAVIAIYELRDIRPLLDLYLFSYMRSCAMYDATVTMTGYDAIRVHYREARRAIIRDVISNTLSGASMQHYIAKRVGEIAREEDRALLLEDVLEDLQEMDISRIAGLGITADQLASWKRAQSG